MTPGADDISCCTSRHDRADLDDVVFVQVLVTRRERVVADDQNRFGKEFEVDQQLCHRARRGNLDLAARIPQQHLHVAATSGLRLAFMRREGTGAGCELLPAALLLRWSGGDREAIAGHHAGPVEDVVLIAGDVADQSQAAGRDRDDGPRARPGPRPAPAVCPERAQQRFEHQMRRISSTVCRRFPFRRPRKYAAAIVTTATPTAIAIAGTLTASARSVTSRRISRSFDSMSSRVILRSGATTVLALMASCSSCSSRIASTPPTTRARRWRAAG